MSDRMKVEYVIRCDDGTDAIRVRANEDGIWLKQGSDTILLNHEEVVSDLRQALNEVLRR